MEKNCYIYRYRPLENFYKWNNDEKKYIKNTEQHAFDEIQNDYFYCSKLKNFDDFNEVMFDIDFSSGNKEIFAIFAKYYHYCLIKYIIELASHSDEMNKKVFQEYRNEYAVIVYDSKDFVQERIIEIISQKQYSQYYDQIGTIMANMLSSVKKSKNTIDFCKNLNNIVVKKCSDSDKVDKILFQGIKNKKFFFRVLTDLTLFSLVEEFEKTGCRQQGIIFSNNEIDNFRKNFINNLYALVLRDYTRTCCFSENNNSDYMWSKYANGSKGVCLIYKATKRQGNNYFIDSTTATCYGINLKKVKYIKNRRRIDFFKYCLGAMDLCKNVPWHSKEQIFACLDATRWKISL